MVKVTGPMQSISASGAFAKSMVFFGWKGINVVRQWLIPTNNRPRCWRNFTSSRTNYNFLVCSDVDHLKVDSRWTNKAVFHG
jgi:hypothetical protein